MRVLVITAMYPTLEKPAFGSFIRTQVESLEKAGVEIELLVLEGSRRKLIYPKGVVQLRRRLRRGGIHLVHAHYSFAGMVARTQWKVPVVVSYCGDDLLGTVDVSGKQTRGSQITVAAGRWLAQISDAVIVKSSEMAGKIKRQDVYIIPHEVDLEVFRPVARDQARAILGLDPHKQYLLFAANPQIPVKRFPLAQAATELLRQSHPFLELQVVYREPQPRLALYMSACDALVFPSFQEGSPNVVKQAMACNLPIVATDVGDVREIIGATRGCYLVGADPREFAGRLGEILLCRQRTRGREQIRHLDCPTVARKIIQVYEETLSKRGSHGRCVATASAS